MSFSYSTGGGGFNGGGLQSFQSGAGGGMAGATGGGFQSFQSGAGGGMAGAAGGGFQRGGGMVVQGPLGGSMAVGGGAMGGAAYGGGMRGANGMMMASGGNGMAINGGNGMIINGGSGDCGGCCAPSAGECSGACGGAETACCEAAGAVTSASWQYVGPGGSYSPVTSYNYVGEGAGSYEKEVVTTFYGWKFRKCCLILMPLLLIPALIYLLMNMNQPDIQP